jgi:hypothetical protein
MTTKDAAICMPLSCHLLDSPSDQEGAVVALAAESIAEQGFYAV